MKLSQLQSLAGVGTLALRKDTDVKGLTRDSKAFKPGDLFLCRAGRRFDSHALGAELAHKGASGLVVHRDLDIPGANLWRVDPMEEGLIAAAFHGNPSHKLGVLGVTGTDGKSTTAFFTAQLINAAGGRAACLGTLGLWRKGTWQSGSLTTPEAETLQDVLAQLLREGHTHCAMEVSSHALSYGRVAGTRFSSVGLTNLGRDHLDDYPSVEAYHQAKLRLFEIQSDPERQVRPASSPGKARRVVGDSVKVEVLGPIGGGLKLQVALDGRTWMGIFPVGGAHNLENLAVALGLAAGAGVPAVDLLPGISTLQSPPGRWQWLESCRGQVMVDYAHTPQALELMLRNLRPHVKGRLSVVFGCGGDRDPLKRPLMGSIASTLADSAIVTDDNPRSEDPSVIRRQILAGASRKPLRECAPREAAIEMAVRELGPQDVLLIAGKGHERVQVTREGSKPFDDAEVAAGVYRRQNAG
ncbi:MAG: Mur ligase family protein [Planctomycetota bacterium]